MRVTNHSAIFVKIIFIVSKILFFRLYFKGAQFSERVSAKNLVAVVTGCNCGIGKQIVRELNIRGAKVYMLCRDENRTQTAIRELIKVYFKGASVIFAQSFIS